MKNRFSFTWGLSWADREKSLSALLGVGVLLFPVLLIRGDTLEDAFNTLEKEKGFKPAAKITDLAAGFDQADMAHVRNMTVAVVSAMDGLSLKAIGAIRDIPNLQQSTEILGPKLTRMRLDRDAYMDEYRRGLFCSGCGKTKSQILALGEQFPHQGQHIVRPTAQEIANKEAELGAPIASGEEELRREQNDLTRARSVLSESLEQLQYGIWLWQTASSFEQNVVARQVTERMKKADAATKKIDQEIALAKAAQMRNEAQADATLKQWLGEKATEDDRQKSDRTTYRAALATVEQDRVLEERKIRGFVERDGLPMKKGFSVSFHYAATGESNHNLGGAFRMGKLYANDDLAASERISLPAVDQFIEEFRRSDSYVISGTGWREWLQK